MTEFQDHGYLDRRKEEMETGKWGDDPRSLELTEEQQLEVFLRRHSMSEVEALKIRNSGIMYAVRWDILKIGIMLCCTEEHAYIELCKFLVASGRITWDKIKQLDAPLWKEAAQ